MLFPALHHGTLCWSRTRSGSTLLWPMSILLLLAPTSIFPQRKPSPEVRKLLEKLYEKPRLPSPQARHPEVVFPHPPLSGQALAVLYNRADVLKKTSELAYALSKELPQVLAELSSHLDQLVGVQNLHPYKPPERHPLGSHRLLIETTKKLLIVQLEHLNLIASELYVQTKHTGKFTKIFDDEPLLNGEYFATP